MSLKDAVVRGAYAVKRAAWRRRRAALHADRRPLFRGRVLVRMDAGIGNAIEVTPLVQAIRALWPRTHLTILPPHGDLFADWCVVDRAAAGERELEGATFDHTFLGWMTSEACEGFTPGQVHRAQGLFPDWLLRPERELNLDPLRRLGYAGPTPPLYVSLRQPREALPEARPRIAICPGGKPQHRWRHKRWPGFAELAAALLDRFPEGHVFCLGGPEDPLDLPAHPHVLDLRGRLTLRETGWVLRECDLAIGNDCGPMHLADAVLTPALTLFGPTCEIKNGPRYRGVALSARIACSPCQYDLALLDSCPEARCMTALTVTKVLDEALALLARAS